MTTICPENLDMDISISTKEKKSNKKSNKKTHEEQLEYYRKYRDAHRERINRHQYEYRQRRQSKLCEICNVQVKIMRVHLKTKKHETNIKIKQLEEQLKKSSITNTN